MLKDYIRKIRKAVNESANPVPTEVENFYSVLSMSCREIPEHEISPQLIE